MISPGRVMAERTDNQPTGERYCELAMTGAIVAAVTPMERREVASFLRGVLMRTPINTSDAYEPHRAVLGSLLLELETFALMDADDQPEKDLRDPAIVAREASAVQEFRDWVALERPKRASAYHAYIDRILEPSRKEHDAADARLAAAVERVR